MLFHLYTVITYYVLHKSHQVLPNSSYSKSSSWLSLSCPVANEPGGCGRSWGGSFRTNPTAKEGKSLLCPHKLPSQTLPRQWSSGVTGPRPILLQQGIGLVLHRWRRTAWVILILNFHSSQAGLEKQGTSGLWTSDFSDTHLLAADSLCI